MLRNLRLETEIQTNKASNLIVVNSDIAKQLFCKIYPDYIKKILPNPIDTSGIVESNFSNFNDEYNELTRKFDFILVCSDYDRKVKYNDFLIDILKSPDFLRYKKCIIGKNNDMFKNIPNSEIYGLLPNTEVFKFLSMSKVLLYPSLFDANPNTCREAFSCKCLPLISNNIAYYKQYPKELVVNDYNKQTWKNKAKYLADNYTKLVDLLNVNFDGKKIDYLMECIIAKS